MQREGERGVKRCSEEGVEKGEEEEEEDEGVKRLVHCYC